MKVVVGPWGARTVDSSTTYMWERFIISAYRRLLDRAPTMDEIGRHIDSMAMGVSRRSIAADIAATNEFFSKSWWDEAEDVR